MASLATERVIKVPYLSSLFFLLPNVLRMTLTTSISMNSQCLTRGSTVPLQHIISEWFLVACFKERFERKRKKDVSLDRPSRGSFLSK